MLATQDESVSVSAMQELLWFQFCCDAEFLLDVPLATDNLGVVDSQIY